MSEADSKNYFKKEIKRLNYYNSQFLKEEDFLDEQRYHVQMRRLHNRALHTWGILEGLEVKRVEGTNKVTVTPGVAVDRLGREIVLTKEMLIPDDTKTPALDSDAYGANTQVYVTVSYLEEFDTSDLDATTTNLYRRATERAKVNTWKGEPPAEESGVVVAVVELDSNRAIKSVITESRRYAGTRIGSSADGTPSGIWADRGGVWHFAEGATGRDRLTINAAGNVGIGTSNPAAPLSVAAKGAQFGMLKLNNTNDKAGDKWWLAFNHGDDSRDTNDRARIGVDIQNTGAGRLYFTTGANNQQQERMRIDENGNVGIGVSNPKFALQIGDTEQVGSLKLCVAGRGSTGNYRQWTMRTGDGSNQADIHKLRIRDEQAGADRLVIDESGNVGIGRDKAGARLDVNGEVRALTLRLANADGTLYTDNWIGMTNNVDGDTKWLHIGGITEGGVRRLGLFAHTIFMDGSVGLGMPKPTGKLEISVPINTTPNVLVLSQSTASWGTMDKYNAFRFITTKFAGAQTDGPFRQFSVGGGGVSIGYPDVPIFGSSDALYVNGNVGIGTPTPGGALHIRRDVTGNVGPTLLIQNAGGNTNAESRIDMSTYPHAPQAPNFRMRVIDDGNHGAHVDFQTKTPGANTNALASRLYIASNGRVGIGTTSPLGPLSVGDSSVANSDGYLVIGKRNDAGGTRHFRIGFDKDFNFTIGDYGHTNTAQEWKSVFAIAWDAPGKSLYINSGGNVGIGTTSISAKLDVAGPVMEKLEVINCNNRGDWSAQNHPIMTYFRDKLRGKPVGTYVKAIQDHPGWRGHYWQGWVDYDGKIRVIHNANNTSAVTS